MEDWIEIRDNARRGVSISEIARQTGHDRKTIRGVLRQEVPKTRRVTTRPRPSKLDDHRAYLDERVAQGCLNGSVLLDELHARGYRGQLSLLNDYLRPFRQERRQRAEASIRFETAPGAQAQVDWASFGRIRVDGTSDWHKLYAFLFTLGYSRAQYLEFVTCCDMEHFLGCHLAAFDALGIPGEILYDNLKTGIVGRRSDGSPLLPGRFLDFALYYGFTPRYCQPYRARTKGKVERGVGYVRQNFWVRVATVVEQGELALSGLNAEAVRWTAEVTHRRVHGTHGEVVADRLAAEAPLLGILDARPRYDPSYRSPRRVGRDGRLSYRGQLYQVSLRHACRALEVRESLAGEITLWTDEGTAVPAAVVIPGRGEGPPPTGQHRAMPPAVEQRDLAVYEEVIDDVRPA